MAVELKGKTTKELREERAKLRRDAQLYHAENSSNWNTQHESHFSGMLSDMNILQAAIEEREAGSKLTDSSGNRLADNPMEIPGQRKIAGDRIIEKGCWLQKGESLSSKLHSRSTVPHAIGEIVRCMAVGGLHSDHIVPEIKSEITSHGTAGLTIRPGYTAEVIDLARAKSVLMGLGCQTYIMGTQDLPIARLASDPSFVVRQELQAITESAVTFSAITFHARSIATLFKVSRELAVDSPNFAQVAEDAISSALAVALDSIGLNGASSLGDNGYQIIGLNEDADIAETGSISSLSWAELSAAATAVRGRNHEPNGAVLATSIHDGLLLSQTTTNEWLTAPPTLANVGLAHTTSQPTAKAIVGDFRNCAWGLRQNLQIETTTEGGDAFETHAVYIKATWRGDFGTMRPGAFQRLAGIS